MDEEKMSPDDVLNALGSRNRVLLTCILICGLAWAPLALTGLCPTFIIRSQTNSTFITITDEFNLTGDSAWLGDATTTFYMIGNMFGGMFIPPLADRYGRLPVFTATLFLMSLSGCISAFSNSIVVFCVMRIFHGTFYTAAGLAGWVLGYENSPLKLRFFTSVYFGMTWVTGACLLGGLAYVLSDWRALMLIISLPNIITAILVYTLVPESLHYLVSSKNTQEIDKWLEKADKKNDIKASEVVDVSANSNTSFTELVREMFKHKIFLVYIGAMTYLWIVDTFIYFGLSFYSQDLAGSVHLNFVLMALVEAPAYIAAPLFMNRYGRRMLISGAHIIAGLCFLGIVFSPQSLHLPFWLLGKFSISCSFMSIYMFASEIFPTDGRNKCIGFCETMSRVGGMLSPYLSHLETISVLAPAITLSVISVTGGLLTLVLPETLNTKLPSTISETASRRQLITENPEDSSTV